MILPLIQYSLDSDTAPKNGAKLRILIDYTKCYDVSFILTAPNKNRCDGAQ